MVRIKPGQKYWFCTQFSWNLWRLFAIDNFSLFRAAGKYFLAGFCQLVFKFYVINFRVGRFFCLKKESRIELSTMFGFILQIRLEKSYNHYTLTALEPAGIPVAMRAKKIWKK